MLKLNFNPTEKHLADIENWLIDQWNTTNKGFYSNWSLISNAFKDDRLIVITESDFAIGFVVYRNSEFTVDIDITEIKPTERENGAGKKLINETLEYLKVKGVLVARLYCQPENSESFWKRIGFENFPKLIDDTKIHLFKPLVETLKPTEKVESNSTIKLWNCQPQHASKSIPKWNWDLKFKADNETLVRPIIIPVLQDWQVELIINGVILESIKVKYLGMDLCDYPGFMIIRKVNL